MTEETFVEYSGIHLASSEVTFLNNLEQELGKPIPHVAAQQHLTFGFTSKKNHISGLGLYRQRLHVLPESIGNLVNLEILILEDNQISLLPETFGNL
ncbi:MAG: hypothetical protein ACFFBD_13110, partial [Candidatus Hodarchaeota archaeon]